MRNLKYYLPGSLMILVAILIVAVPEVLIILSASVIIMAGIGTLYLGHLFRRMNTEFKNVEQAFVDNNFYGFRVIKVPGFRRR